MSIPYTARGEGGDVISTDANVSMAAWDAVKEGVFCMRCVLFFVFCFFTSPFVTCNAPVLGVYSSGTCSHLTFPSEQTACTISPGMESVALNLTVNGAAAAPLKTNPTRSKPTKEEEATTTILFFLRRFRGSAFKFFFENLLLCDCR